MMARINKETREKYDVKLVDGWGCPTETGIPVITMPNVYKALHGVAPRTLLGSSTWNHMRKRCYYDAGYKCEVCGAEGVLHAHELYDTNWKDGWALFRRCVCLCPQCVDEETEVLTKDGWKKIPLVTTDDLVACWDKDNSITFQHPTATIKSHHDNAIKITGATATLYFSENHRLPLKVASKQSPTSGQIKDVLAGDYKASHYYNWLTAGENHKDEHLTAEERVYIAIEADGHLAYDKENPRRGERQRAISNRYGTKDYRYTYEIHLLKTRKIERFKMLLEESGMKYKIAKHTSENYCDFVIWSNKELKHFANCFDIDMGKEKALEFIEELVFWDGTYTRGIANWYTNKPEEVAFVQAIAAQTNIRTCVSVINRIGNLRKGQWETPYERCSYSVNFRSMTSEVCAREMKPSRIKWNKDMYCLSVPTTYFLARRDNFVFITGNCHVYFIHSGRALTLYKKGNPMYSAHKLLEGAEHGFKLVYEWNEAHPKDPLRVYATFIDYLKEPELREPMEKLIKKYKIKFYMENENHVATWSKWRLIIGGKSYPTPYKNREEWEEAMNKTDDPQRKIENPFTGGIYDEWNKIIKGKSNEKTD